MRPRGAASEIMHHACPRGSALAYDPGVRARPLPAPFGPPPAWWTLPATDVAAHLRSSEAGLASSEAEARLEVAGPNVARTRRGVSHLAILFRQLRSPLLALLLFAAVVSLVLREWVDAVAVIAIVAASVVIGDVREYRAEQHGSGACGPGCTRARRCGATGGRCEIPIEEVVPGDVVVPVGRQPRAGRRPAFSRPPTASWTRRCSPARAFPRRRRPAWRARPPP